MPPLPWLDPVFFSVFVSWLFSRIKPLDLREMRKLALHWASSPPPFPSLSHATGRGMILESPSSFDLIRPAIRCKAKSVTTGKLKFWSNHLPRRTCS